MNEAFNQSEDFTFATLLAASVHDLKNVLASVLESLDWLNNNINNLTKEQQQEFSKTSQLVAHVNSELMELLCFFKFENKQYSMAYLEHNVAECLESQVLFMSSLVKTGQITINFSCDEELVWNFDQTLVNTAIRNAAMNALKVAKTKIQFLATIENGYLKLQVVDDGEGYPEAILGRLEGYIGKVDLNTNSTGLGLYFAEKVAKMHNNAGKQGYIELTNEKNSKGASFNLYLP